MGSFFVIATIFAAGAQTDQLRGVLDAHDRTLARFETVDVEIDNFHFDKEGKESLFEYTRWLKSGIREKFIEKDFATVDPDTFTKRPLSPPDCREYGYGIEEIRILRGWDVDAPFPLPLRPGGKNGDHYARTRCTIMPRDPTTAQSRAPFWLLLSVVPGYSLERFIKASTNAKVAEDAEGIIRISATDDKLGPVVLQLDPKKGHLIKCFDLITDKVHREVRQFDEAKPGIYFPTVVRASYADGTALEMRVKKLAINEEIAESAMHVEFPEGARVDDSVRKTIDIWGPGGKPALTFRDYSDFSSWELRTVSGSSTSKTEGGPTPILFVNAGILALIVVLIFIRRRIHRAT